MTNALIFGLTGQDGAYISQFLLKKGYNVSQMF
jgi:GDP-D-mannose dehydratase